MADLYTVYFAFLLCGILVIFDQIQPLHNKAFLCVTLALLFTGLVVLENADGLVVLLALLFLQTYKNVFIIDVPIEKLLQTKNATEEEA
jgi:hypothetical protein